MKKSIIVALMITMFASVAYASAYIATGVEALAPTSAMGVTSTLLVPSSGRFKGVAASELFITVETNPIRFTMNGTNPTSTTGHKLGVGESVIITGVEDVKRFRCIDTAAGASSVTVTVFHNVNE